MKGGRNDNVWLDQYKLIFTFKKSNQYMAILGGQYIFMSVYILYFFLIDHTVKLQSTVFFDVYLLPGTLLAY